MRRPSTCCRRFRGGEGGGGAGGKQIPHFVRNDKNISFGMTKAFSFGTTKSLHSESQGASWSTGTAVVLRGKYLRGFELRGAGLLWKSLWNCWPWAESLAVEICQGFREAGFLASKA